MIIEAEVKDQVQKALRERKAKWNRKVSDFIDNVINLKKMMNGYPSKFHMERNKITERLPKEPDVILGVLAGDFRDIVNEGNNIINTQLSYSQSRVKPASISMNDLNDQYKLLSLAINNSGIVIEGSNPFSRFFSKFRGKMLGKSPEALKRNARLSMLTSSHDLFKLCKEFQSNIIKYKAFGDDTEGLAEANDILLLMESKWNGINMTFANAANKLTESKDGEKDIFEIVESIKEDIKSYSNRIDKENKDEINNLLKFYDKETGSFNKKKSADEIIKVYENILEKLSEKHGFKINSIKELIDKENKIKDFGEKIKIIKEDLGMRSAFIDFFKIIDKETIVESEKLIKDFEEKPSSELAERIISIYNDIILLFNSKKETNGSSLKEIKKQESDKITETKKIIEEKKVTETKKATANIIDTTYNKTLRSLTSRTTSSNRLIAFNSAEDMRNNLDKLMDLLEKDLELNEVSELLNIINKNLSYISSSFKAIIINYSGKNQKIDKIIETRKNKEIAEMLYPRSFRRS